MSVTLKWNQLFKISNHLLWRGVYSGPISTLDYTKTCNDDDESWEAKKLRNIRQRVIDIGKGVQFEGTEKLIDEDARKVDLLPHMIFTENPEQYSVEGDIFSIMGNATKEHKAFSDKCSNLDPDFVRSEVQEILKSLCGKDLDKIYKKMQAEFTEMPRIRLLTTEQLQQEFDEISKQADELLAMPPVMTAREEIDETVAMDEALDGYEHCNVVFTDISEDLRNNERFVVVREPNGKLRKANWSERDRMLQTYFTKPGKTIVKPFLFDDMSVAFSNHFHENVLEQIIVQFEPDSAEFIRLTTEVYDDIIKNKLFELLRSTRFFGGLAFYQAKHGSIDGLLVYFLENNLAKEAGDLVTLYTLVRPHSKTAERLQANATDLDKIQVYFSNDAEDKRSINEVIEKLSSSKQMKAS